MKKCLITGGLGFIGYNAAQRYAARGWAVTLWDDLSRGTAGRNKEDFDRRGWPNVRLVRGDVRDGASLERLFHKHGPFDLILHLAAQVAVTTSVADPALDFDVNARGTFNVLEAARRLSPKAFMIFASTNKVYGEMEGTELQLAEERTRWALKKPREGISEAVPLDFHSPYGCSKGSADQYVRDYARIYGLKTVVFRQSCIYGPWQYGEADQGWVAWFLIAARQGRPLFIYGDGKQVRDALYIDDLLDLYERAWKDPAASAGKVFNIGGGPRNTISLIELLAWLKREHSLEPSISVRDWRPGDQKVYISDIRRAKAALGWAPKVGLERGLENLWTWLSPRLGAPRRAAR